ncbi:hypothetical protein CR513_38420, partial [Mucuna pruriens]
MHEKADVAIIPWPYVVFNRGPWPKVYCPKTLTCLQWENMLKTYGDGEKYKKVKLQTLRSMQEKELVGDYFDKIQKLVNAMRACKEKVIDKQVVTKILRTLPPEFDYAVVVIEESKDLDTMEVEELQHFLEAHEIINKRISTQEQAL